MRGGPTGCQPRLNLRRGSQVSANWTAGFHQFPFLDVPSPSPRRTDPGHPVKGRQPSGDCRMYRRTLGMLAVALALAACASTPTISSDVTRGANFSNYKSYEWVNALPPAGMNPVAYERVKQDIESAMSAKGYSKGSPGDLSLILTVGTRDKTDINTWGRWGHQVDVYQYTEGQVSLDAFDTRTRLQAAALARRGQPDRRSRQDRPGGDRHRRRQVMAKFPGTDPGLCRAGRVHLSDRKRASSDPKREINPGRRRPWLAARGVGRRGGLPDRSAGAARRPAGIPAHRSAGRRKSRRTSSVAD